MTKTLIAAALAGCAWAGVARAQTVTMPDPSQRPEARAVTRAQASARADMMFNRMDRNHDGKLTADELTPASPPVGATDAAMPARGGARHGPRMFERLDTNHDGSVSRDEYRAQALARFDRLDTNHDGVVDPAEREAARSFAAGRGVAGGPVGLGRAHRSGSDMAPSAPLPGNPAPGQ